MEEIGTDFCADEGGGTNVHVAVDREYIGHIIVTDTVKEGAAEAVSELRAAGIRRMAILTGDNPSVSRAVGDAVGIEDVRAGLLPDGKMRELENIMRAAQAAPSSSGTDKRCAFAQKGGCWHSHGRRRLRCRHRGRGCRDNG